MKAAFCLLVVAGLLVGAAFVGPAVPVIPEKPLIAGKTYALITYDVDDKPLFVNDSKFLDWLDSHVGKGRHREVESTATFNDDQPEFKSLMADPERTSADWVTIGTAKKVSGSKALPKDAASTEALIGKYTR